MYRRDPDGEIQGVLDGWDLATWNSDSGAIMTGMIAFTAWHLVADRDHERQEAKLATLYRHAAESFLWVLLYISLKDSSCSSELERWHDLDQSHYSRISLIFSRSSGQYVPAESRAPLFKYAARLLALFWHTFVLPFVPEQREVPDEEAGKEFIRLCTPINF
jgi:hypothetical protein